MALFAKVGNMMGSYRNDDHANGTISIQLEGGLGRNSVCKLTVRILRQSRSARARHRSTRLGRWRQGDDGAYRLAQRRQSDLPLTVGVASQNGIWRTFHL